MTLNEILSKFASPPEASEVCGKSRTTGYHWFAEGTKRVIPPLDVLVCWADHFKLSDEQLGKLVRDCLILQKIKPKRRRRVLKSKSIKQEPEPVPVLVRQWEEKEQYLQDIEKNTESAIEDNVFDRMKHLIERHIK